MPAIPEAKREPAIVEIAEAPEEPEPEPVTETAREETMAECNARFVIERLDKSSPGCTVDVPDEGSQATLECDGSRVSLKFEARAYQGEVRNGRVDLDLVSTYDFNDGCQWQGTAHVSGSPGSGFDLEYQEQPIRGAQCSQACTARARIVAVK